MTHPLPSLSSLLGNVTLTQFVRDHWDQHPLHLRGAPERLRGILDRQSLRTRIRNAPKATIKAYFPDSNHGVTHRFGVRPTLDIQSDQVDAALAAGAGIIFQDLHVIDEQIGVWVTMLRRELGFVGKVICSAWLAPPGSVVEPHFDATSVFSFQLEGTKVWRVSPKPALLRPTTAALALADGTFVYREGNSIAPRRHEWEHAAEPFDAISCEEMRLEPGDVMFVPAGCWHATSPVDDSRSLSVSVMFEPVSLVEWLAQAFAAELSAHPAWRHIPLQPDTHDGALPASLKVFLSERLEELSHRFRSDDAIEHTLHRAFKQSLVKPPGITLPSPPSLRDFDANPIEQTDVLVCPGPIRWTWVQSKDTKGNPTIEIFAGQREVLFDDPTLVAFGRNLADRTSFVARDAMSWADAGGTYPWEQVRELLTALVSEGILAVVSRA